MYSHPPTLTFDLTNLPSSFDTNLEADHMIERVQKIHEEIVKKLNSYKFKNIEHKLTPIVERQLFNLETYSWCISKKSKLLATSSSKLVNRKFEPFTILDKFGDNAFQVDLPTRGRVSFGWEGVIKLINSYNQL